MRAVHSRISGAELEWRKKTGIDRWDEMWDGVLHMTPAPNVEHHRMLDEMIEFLKPLLRTTSRGRLISGVNVFGANDENYRIPDLTFAAAGREHVFAKDGVRDNGPDAVIEIRSPDDETDEKLPFYAAIGVREVIVIGRDSKQPEIHRLDGREFVKTAADPEGWIVSDTMRVRFRRVDAEPPRLDIADLDDAGLRVAI